MPDIDEAVIKRIPPHDTQAEQSVLGGLLMDPGQINMLSEILVSGKQFFNKGYGIIYDAMLELERESRAIDPVTLVDKLKEKDIPPESASYEQIGNIVAQVPTSANVKYYAQIVAEKSTLRDLIKVTENIAADSYKGKESVNTLLEDTEKKVFEIVQRRNVGEITPIDQVVMESLNMIEKAARTTGDVTGLASGFLDLDHKTAGFQPGNLVLIAARPAMGKTSFVLSLVHNIVVRQDKPVVMFSLEMSKAELVNRLLAMDSKVDSQKFKTGQLNDGEWESLAESGGIIANSKLKMENDIQLVVIDYLQLMNGSGRTDSRQQEISEISRALKLMAKELGIPVIALSQLSRQVEQRTDHRPMLSDLRESGAIEQDADVVMFIYRDEVYNENSDKKNIALKLFL